MIGFFRGPSNQEIDEHVSDMVTLMMLQSQSKMEFEEYQREPLKAFDECVSSMSHLLAAWSVWHEKMGAWKRARVYIAVNKELRRRGLDNALADRASARVRLRILEYKGGLHR
jgi:hypothetical protein